MKRIAPTLAAAAALAVAAIPANAAVERVVEKTFSVQPGGNLHVGTIGGLIRVQSAAVSAVTVVAKEHIRADSDAEADGLLKKLTLTIEQSGNDVSAVADYEKSPMGFHWNWPPVRVDFIVTVPAAYHADLKTSGGDITVSDLDGRVRARTSGGDISLGKISGEIDCETSGGNVSLGEGRSAIRLGTSGGSISVGRAAGPADLRTSGGDVRIDSAEGTLDARTSGGDVRAVFIGALKGDCVLETSGGRVKAVVDAAAAFRLDASTSGGSVDAKGLAIALDGGRHHRSSLAGDVNGGGPLLRMRSSGGDIVVETHGTTARRAASPAVQ
jgi:hypothetical protein